MVMVYWYYRVRWVLLGESEIAGLTATIEIFLQHLEPWTLPFFAGPSGTVVTLSGTGFGTDPQLVSVTMNGAACNVTSVSDTEVRCTAGSNPGGTYPVALHHQVKGHAKSAVSFVYELTMSAVQPNQGKTEAIEPKLKSNSVYDRSRVKVWWWNYKEMLKSWNIILQNKSAMRC